MKKTVFATTILCIAFFAVMALASTALASTAPCEPQVSTTAADPFWESFGDYIDHRLTVDESLQNTGGCVPCMLRVMEMAVSDGVSLDTPLPIDLGSLAQAGMKTIRVKYKVPSGVTRFQSRVRVVCAPGPKPVASSQFTVEPPLAWANDSCPVPPPGLDGVTPPDDQHYGPRTFTATLKDADGNPVAGKSIKWGLSEPYIFRIDSSTNVTDVNGQATVTVSPPLYFICVYPYFSEASTRVIAVSEDGQDASATFVYSRCISDPGAMPPWAGSSPMGSGI